MRGKLFVLSLLLLLFVVGIAQAVDISKTHSITLLSVSELSNGTIEGGTATLYLQLRPGTGAVFLEAYPLAKVDTQVATRVANEIACEFTTSNCDEYDFFYTIRADSPIIGGPSAGGATALLTLSVLEDVPLREDFAMTGAIASGGVITSVDGIKEKITGAREADKALAIIPKLAFWTANETAELLNNQTNITQEVQEYINKLPTLENVQTPGVQVLPVITLQEALQATATKKYEFSTPASISPQLDYESRMKETANILCQRTEDLASILNSTSLNQSLWDIAQEHINRSIEAVTQERYYSQASYCYSANLYLREAHLQQLDQSVLEENLELLKEAHQKFEEAVDSYEHHTFSDLETYTIVKERLLESAQYLEELNESNIDPTILALGMERYYSAVAWSEFFGLPGKELDIDEVSVRSACMKEIQQAEGRQQYLESFLPKVFLVELDKEINQVYTYIDQEAYALCLFKASKANARANFILTAAGLHGDGTQEVVQIKLARTREVIKNQEKNDVFPILGYSYYEYASDMLANDASSALLFVEYALSFSDLSAYFKQRTILSFASWNIFSSVLFFASGFIFGVLFVGLSLKRSKRRQAQTHHKKSYRKKRK